MGIFDQKEAQQKRALLITAGAVAVFLVVLVVAVVLSVTQRNNATPEVGQTIGSSSETQVDTEGSTGDTPATDGASGESATASGDSAESTDGTSTDAIEEPTTDTTPAPAPADSVPDTGPESLAVVAVLIGVAVTLFLANRELKRELSARNN